MKKFIWTPSIYGWQYRLDLIEESSSEGRYEGEYGGVFFRVFVPKPPYTEFDVAIAFTGEFTYLINSSPAYHCYADVREASSLEEGFEIVLKELGRHRESCVESFKILSNSIEAHDRLTIYLKGEREDG